MNVKCVGKPFVKKKKSNLTVRQKSHTRKKTYEQNEYMNVYLHTSICTTLQSPHPGNIPVSTSLSLEIT